MGRVGVEAFDVLASLGYSETVAVLHGRCEVANHNNAGVPVRSAPYEAEYRVRCITMVNPFKALRGTVHLVQCWSGLVKVVEVAHESLNAGVLGFVEQVPVQTLVVVPFIFLSELAPHEKQLFSRVAKHESQIGS